MAIIGRITKDGDIYTGTIETLSFKAQIDLKPVEKRNDKAPNYRVYTSQSEVGAAWWMTSERGEEYLSVKLDDPASPAPSTSPSSRRKTEATMPSGRAPQNATKIQHRRPVFGRGVPAQKRQNEKVPPRAIVMAAPFSPRRCAFRRRAAATSAPPGTMTPVRRR